MAIVKRILRTLTCTISFNVYTPPPPPYTLYFWKAPICIGITRNFKVGGGGLKKSAPCRKQIKSKEGMGIITQTLTHAKSWSYRFSIATSRGFPNLRDWPTSCGTVFYHQTKCLLLLSLHILTSVPGKEKNPETWFNYNSYNIVKSCPMQRRIEPTTKFLLLRKCNYFL